jgi:hypothetical protein
MAPNLYLKARKLANPCEWFKIDVKYTHQYHYQCEPVPGVYATVKCNGTYLYAIRPNCKKDPEKFFDSRPGFNNQLKQNNTSAPQIDITATPKNSTESTNQSTTTNSINPTNSVRPISINVNLPLQESPLRKCANSSSTSLSSLIHNNPNVTKVKSIDFGGFKHLRQPLKVEYNYILQRWMFSSEIRTRKFITDMCVQRTCIEPDPRVCGKTLSRELFALDDGISWIVIGDVKHGRTT